MKEKGTYLLILHVSASYQQLRIGRLGRYDIAAGYYLYVGSAFGPGGLSARLAYHRQRIKPRPHWHIDYLRPYAHLQATWAVACPQHLEHTWCRALMDAPAVEMPIRGFGSSDSALPTHLFFLSRPPSLRFLSATLLTDTVLAQSDTVRVMVVIDTLPDADSSV